MYLLIHRRYSRSPRRDRDRRRDRYSRSNSRDRRVEKSDPKSDKASKNVDKPTAAKKPAVPGKKLPFIGRMPVFKKQATGMNQNCKIIFKIVT